MDSVAITDHGAMYGAIEFYNACRKEGVKPIVGLEAYTTNKDHKIKNEDGSRGADAFHLLLLAKDEEGYKNLMKLTSIAHTEGYYYRPRFDKKTLEKYSKGLICTSACPASELAQALINEENKKAKEIAIWFQQLFGKDYYLEIQNHEYEGAILKAENSEIRTEMEKMAGIEKVINAGVLKLSRELGIPIIATNDAHYINHEDAHAQDVLVCVATGKQVSETKRIRFIDNPNFYIKSPEDMSALFPTLPEVLENTLKIAEKCNLEISTYGKWFFPEYPDLDGENPETALKRLVYERLPVRVGGETQEIKERVEHELAIICGKGYAPYFLITQDFVSWANTKGIITNTRGSAAGSLVSFILGITTVNPLLYYLPFERFLNPFRPSPPDIDFDVADDKREEIINYIADKYGHDKVAQICTFGRMLARAAIRDVARVLGYPYVVGDRLSKVTPPPKQGFPTDIPKALTESSELKQMYDTDPDSKKILDLAHQVEGSARHLSVHAAGVVVSPTDMRDFSPVQLEPSGDKIITQYEMHACEDVGLIKFDILGIRNLSILGAAVDIVQEIHGKRVILGSISLDDKKTYEMLGRGETMGVFQLGGSGMTRYLKDLKPTRVEDLMAMVALFRPGPMSVIPEYIARKHDPKLINYLDPRMEKFLKASYGLIIYQDDLLFCALDLAGYSWEEADKFRKAVGKKIPAEMAAQKAKFVTGIIENGQTQEFAENLWKLFEPFQAYGFNKAHAASYGMIAYQTAYMKANYPVEYMCALMTAESGDTDKVAQALSECRRMKINVLPPDINESITGFKIVEDKKSLGGRAILFGFSAIKNVGVAAIENILEGRKTQSFKSLNDFFGRVDNQKVNKKKIECLIKAGAFDKFGKRASVLAAIEQIRSRALDSQKKSQNGQTDLFEEEVTSKTFTIDNLPDIEDFSQEEKLAQEKELLGFYVTENPISHAITQISSFLDHKLTDITQDMIGQKVKIGGVVETQRVVVTKNGNREMAFIVLEDDTGKVDLVVFPSLFSKTKIYWNTRQPLVIDGKVEYREDSISVIVEDVKTVADLSQNSDTQYQAKEGEVVLRIPRGTDSKAMVQINQLLQQHRGDQVLVVLVENGFGDKKITLPYGISWTLELEKKIKELLL